MKYMPEALETTEQNKLLKEERKIRCQVEVLHRKRG